MAQSVTSDQTDVSLLLESITVIVRYTRRQAEVTGLCGCTVIVFLRMGGDHCKGQQCRDHYCVSYTAF